MKLSGHSGDTTIGTASRRGLRSARSNPERRLLLGLVGGRVGGQGRDERLLRNIHATDGLHALLALLLLLQQLALTGDVAAVALGQDVLADRPNILAGNDFRPDR